MSENSTLARVVLFALFAAIGAVAWFDQRPNVTVWVLRIACPAGAAIQLLSLIRKIFRHDIAPDFLAKYSPSYFDCNGFCFSFFPSHENNTFMVNMIFQNRYERPSIAEVAIKPCGFWPFGNELTSVFHIQCGPGSFGMANLPMGLPAKYQGKKQRFYVGAEVSYPEGKGEMLRFRGATTIRHNLHFRNKFMIMASILMLTRFHFMWEMPSRCTIQVPDNVLEQLPENSKQYTEIMWNLNDDYQGDFSIKGFSHQT